MSVRVVVVPRSFGIPRRYWISAAAHVLLLFAWAWAPSRTMPAIALPFWSIKVSYSAAPRKPPIRPLIWPLRNSG